MTEIFEGRTYLMPTKRAAKCRYAGHSIATFVYSDCPDEVTLSRPFCERRLLELVDNRPELRA